MTIKRVIFSVLAILAGLLMFVYAGIDDSPGGQLIGMVVVIGGVLGLIKGRKRTSN
jgi:drug/metabolite transporter (DMT)-like permease